MSSYFFTVVPVVGTQKADVSTETEGGEEGEREGGRDRNKFDINKKRDLKSYGKRMIKKVCVYVCARTHTDRMFSMIH